MENSTSAYLMENYKLLELLKETEGYRIELVLGTDRNTYIRRCIKNNHAPYKLLASLKDDKLAKVLYVVEAEDTTYVIEEYVQGNTLQQHLEQQGYFSETQVKNIALELSNALDTLHGKGIVHRDIKPDNIILQDSGHIKLIDYNAARLMNKEHKHDTRVMGTEGYAPPEQYGFMTTDERSDWYAVGKTLQQLLEPNYQGCLTEVINKCTRFDPQERISSGKEFRALLENKKNYKYIGIGLALLIALGGVVWGLSHKQSDVPTSQTPGAKQASVKPKTAENTTNKSENNTDNKSTNTTASKTENQQTNTLSEASKKDLQNYIQKHKEEAARTWPERKKKIDETMPLRHLDVKSVALWTKGEKNKYPRELFCYGPLQGITLFQREREFDKAFLSITFHDFTVIPPEEGTASIIANHKEAMTFVPWGDINLGVSIDLTSYLRRVWEPYCYMGPIWGDSKCKYYQLGPNPRIEVKLQFLDGQEFVKSAPIKVVERNNK